MDCESVRLSNLDLYTSMDHPQGTVLALLKKGYTMLNLRALYSPHLRHHSQHRDCELVDSCRGRSIHHVLSSTLEKMALLDPRSWDANDTPRLRRLACSNNVRLIGLFNPLESRGVCTSWRLG
jgi:hypothetical protein